MSCIPVTNNEKLSFKKIRGFIHGGDAVIASKSGANKKFIELTRNINPIKYTWDL